MKALRALGLILLALHVTVVVPPRSEAASASEIDADRSDPYSSHRSPAMASASL
jgi:hypothetical protein